MALPSRKADVPMTVTFCDEKILKWPTVQLHCICKIIKKEIFFIPCLNIQTIRLTSSSLAKIFLVRFGIERTRPKTLQLANEDG